MESLEEEDDERFKKQFARYLEDDIGSADIEEMYTSAFAAIREDPSHKPTEKDVKKWKTESKKYRPRKLSREMRRQRIQEKIEAYKAGKLAADDDDEAEEEEPQEEEEDDE